MKTPFNMKRFIALFLLSLTFAFGQAVSLREIPLPAGPTTRVDAFAASPDGRLWLVAQPTPTSLGSLMMQTYPGSDSFQTATSTLYPWVFETKGYSGNTARLDSFFPQNGIASTFGPGSWVGYAYQDFEWEASPGGWQQLCTSYTVDGTGTSSGIRSGPFFGTDGNKYYIGGIVGQGSTIYLRGNTANGACNLITKDASPDLPVLQAWEQPNGSFLVERVIASDPINWSTTEVGLLSGGVTTMLVSPRASSHPAITAQLCCDMVWDGANQTALVTYRDGSGGHAFLYKNGKIQPIYDNKDGKASQNIRAMALNSAWAVIGASASNQYRIDEELLVNTSTLQIWSIVKAGTALPEGFRPGSPAVSPEGIVYFTAGDSNNTALFAATIQGVTGFSKPTVTLVADKTLVSVGDQIGLTWSSQNATSVVISDSSGQQFSYGTSGSKVVTITATTTFTATATGPGGAATASVTIGAITPPPPPIIKAVIPATGSGQTALVAGGLFSAFGTDMCGVVSDDANATVTTPNLPKLGILPIEAGRCRIKIDGSYVPLMFGVTWDKLSPHQSQVNGQLPRGLTSGQHTMVVERRAYGDDSLDARSGLFMIDIVSNNPSLFGALDQGLQVILQDLNARLITASNPARQCSILTTYGTQFGALQTPLPDGSSPDSIGMSGLDLAQVQPEAWLKVRKPDGTWSSYRAQVPFAGASPQFVGVDQINIQLPVGIQVDPTSTTASLIITQGGVQTQDYAFAFNPLVQKQ